VIVCLFIIHYKNSNSVSSRCIFWCVFVAIIWSNQIERSRSYYVFQKSSELWTRCNCTKLASHVWTSYILYFILAKFNLASWTKVVYWFCQKIKPTRYCIMYIKFYKYVGCMSIRKLLIKIVIYITVKWLLILLLWDMICTN
jgi:hypothetical protein